jgi:hypothetical protein
MLEILRIILLPIKLIVKGIKLIVDLIHDHLEKI